MPISRIATITFGQTCVAGVDPADSARTSAGACRSKRASAICERPALWLHTNSTYFIPGLRRLAYARNRRDGASGREGRVPTHTDTGPGRRDQRLPVDASRGAGRASGGSRYRPSAGTEQGVRRLLGPRRHTRQCVRCARGGRGQPRQPRRELGGRRRWKRAEGEVADARCQARDDEALGSGRAGSLPAGRVGHRCAARLRRAGGALPGPTGRAGRSPVGVDRRRVERDGDGARSPAERARLSGERRGDHLRSAHVHHRLLRHELRLDGRRHRHAGRLLAAGLRGSRRRRRAVVALLSVRCFVMGDRSARSRRTT